MIMLKLIEAHWPVLLLQDLRQLHTQPGGIPSNLSLCIRIRSTF